MNEWWRQIGTWIPPYGNCGGFDLDCSKGCGEPLDRLDICCLHHDVNLFLALQLPSDAAVKEARAQADRTLGKELRGELRPFARKIYGPLWAFVARMVFRP